MRWPWRWRRRKAIEEAEAERRRSAANHEHAKRELAEAKRLAEWARQTTAANRFDARLAAAYRTQRKERPT